MQGLAKQDFRQADQKAFQQGSMTYYNASKNFPSDVLTDVAKLYSFVRLADNFVDAKPQDADGFNRLVDVWKIAKIGALPGRGDDTGRAICNMVEVAQKYDISHQLVDDFLKSMQMDLTATEYANNDDLNEYIYGSAEVIGLMMARLMGLSPECDKAARKQGAAMQLINFVRDIAEDISLGRQYIPVSDVAAAGLGSLSEKSARSNPEAFAKLIAQQLARYRQWQAEADQGLQLVPVRYRRAVQVANDGYAWTARQIERDPLSVFIRAHKPSQNYLAWRSVIRTLLG